MVFKRPPANAGTRARRLANTNAQPKSSKGKKDKKQNFIVNSGSMTMTPSSLGKSLNPDYIQAGNTIYTDVDPLAQYEQEQLLHKKDSTHLSFKAAATYTRLDYATAVRAGDGKKVFQAIWVSPSRHDGGKFDRRGNPRDFKSATMTMKNVSREHVEVNCTAPFSDPAQPSVITGRANFGTRTIAPGEATTYKVSYKSGPMNYPVLMKQSAAPPSDQGVPSKVGALVVMEMFDFFIVRENINESSNTVLNDDANILDVTLKVDYSVSSVFPADKIESVEVPEFGISTLGKFETMYDRKQLYTGPMGCSQVLNKWRDNGFDKPTFSISYDATGGFNYIDVDPNGFPSSCNDHDRIFFPFLGMCFDLKRNNPGNTDGGWLLKRVNDPWSDGTVGQNIYEGAEFSTNQTIYYYDAYMLADETNLRDPRFNLKTLVTWLAAATKVVGIVAALV